MGRHQHSHHEGCRTFTAGPCSPGRCQTRREICHLDRIGGNAQQTAGCGYWDQLIMWILYDECDGDWDCFYDYFGWADSYSGYSGDWSGYSGSSGDGSGYDYSGYDWSGYDESGSGGWWSWFWKAMEKKGANKSDMKALMDALKNRK